MFQLPPPFPKPVNHAPAQGRPEDYQTFRVCYPRDGAIVQACKDAGCPAWTHGWKTTLDERTPFGRAQAHYIRWQSGRTFREQKTGDGKTVFVFEAHQRCFDEHKTRPQLFLVEGGDWRGNPTGFRRFHQRPDDWLEHFAENQLKLADQAQQGRY
jgi:hypothetical protein